MDEVVVRLVDCPPGQPVIDHRLAQLENALDSLDSRVNALSAHLYVSRSGADQVLVRKAVEKHLSDRDRVLAGARPLSEESIAAAFRAQVTDEVETRILRRQDDRRKVIAGFVTLVGFLSAAAFLGFKGSVVSECTRGVEAKLTSLENRIASLREREEHRNALLNFAETFDGDSIKGQSLEFSNVLAHLDSVLRAEPLRSGSPTSDAFIKLIGMQTRASGSLPNVMALDDRYSNSPARQGAITGSLAKFYGLRAIITPNDAEISKRLEKHLRDSSFSKRHFPQAVFLYLIAEYLSKQTISLEILEGMESTELAAGATYVCLVLGTDKIEGLDEIERIRARRAAERFVSQFGPDVARKLAEAGAIDTFGSDPLHGWIVHGTCP